MEGSVRRVNAVVIALVLGFAVAVAIATVGLLQNTKQAALDAAESQAIRFVSGAEAALNRSLLGVDVMLASVDELLGLSGIVVDWIDSPAASRLMRGSLQQNLLVQYVALLDADSRVLASSSPGAQGTNVPLPPGFLKKVLAEPSSALLVSEPVVSFISAQRVVYLARFIRMADASRVVAVAELQVQLLTPIMVQGAEIKGLEVSLERKDGSLLASVPLRDAGLPAAVVVPLAPGADPLAPRFEAARVSGAPAIVVTHPILYHDINISASIAVDEALEEWRNERRFIIGVAALFELTVLVLGGLALWYMRRMAQARITVAESKASLDQALESMQSGFLLLDANGCVITWNRAYLEILPYVAGIQVGVPYRDILVGAARFRHPKATQEELEAWVKERDVASAVTRASREIVLPNGTAIRVTERRTPTGGLVIVYDDITQSRAAAAEIEQLAFYDPLTQLPNRRLLNDRLQQALTASSRSGRRGALLFLDLDHFKTLNDSLGHDMGDLLLGQVAQRLLACVREEDTVARLGGDEFVVMIEGLPAELTQAEADAQRLGEKILAHLNQPYPLGTHTYSSTPSVGATLFGRETTSAVDLLKQADIAMYEVKSAGRNGFCFFNTQMLSVITERVAMESDLRDAIEDDQFVLHYQAQVDLDNMAIGAEVLIRWHHPVRGMVSPLAFIGLAEETGLIVPIGLWVLQTACEQLADWSQYPQRANLQLAVNVSARQFRQADFVAHVQAVLADTGANPSRLKLELTESLVLDNVQDTIQKMHALKKLGVRFSMDDFGTGHSSLTYLTQLPLQQLKIDQSFVRNIGQNTADSVIIDTIIAMANSLGLEVIAEGVETQAQREFLAQHGCNLCQGYLFGKPMALAEFEKMLPDADAFTATALSPLED
jgi:diguanylate cyclase (GGDEF)-like protein